MEKHIDLDLLKRFYVVAHQKSITKAAHILQMTQPALSRSLKSLEDSAGERLFVRVSTGMELNTKGEELLAYTKSVLDDLGRFERIFFDDENQVSGDFKILTFPYVASELLIPVLGKFMADFPDVRISIDSHLSPNPYDMMPISHDVSIGFYIPDHENLMQWPLFTHKNQLFASAEYLAKHKAPENLDDLKKHQIIYQKNAGYKNIIHETNMDEYNVCLELDSINSLINATLKGLGICELPNFKSILSSGLQNILPNISGQEVILYYTLNANRKNSKKINVFFEYLKKNLSDNVVS